MDAHSPVRDQDQSRAPIPNACYGVDTENETKIADGGPYKGGSEQVSLTCLFTLFVLNKLKPLKI